MNGLFHALDPAGPQAALIAQLWWLTVAVCALVLVAVLLAFFIALRRAPRADAATPADVKPLQQAEPRTRLVVTAATIASAVLLVGLVAASAATDRALMQLPLQNALNVQVTANQWWWDVRYDDPDPSRIFATANEIYVPVGRPVIVRLRANDVIHSFWVPNLHGKKDLIPGTEGTIHFRADRAGTYHGQCAEYCGLQHAFMAFVVHAVPQEEFDRWAESQRKPAAAPSTAPQKRGHDLFMSGTCMMCHAIQGTPAQARKGPDLTHVASRERIAAGRLANTPENLASWIRDPHRHKPGVNMPAHVLAQGDLEALVAYLGALR
ncbi:MAG TPA: cytochrome c oxidase subunit II [Usitatibacter sp.]|nr:cytochrome c oxidase subunit II [Usitatibacter sp.]